MKKIFTPLLLCSIISISAQNTELVFVFFKDKPNKAAFYANPQSELSQKALDRRSAKSIALNDQDAPIETTYIQNVKNLGFTVKDYSKWLNGVAVNATKTQIETLKSQNYVASVESFVKNSNGGKQSLENRPNKWDDINPSQKANFNYGSASSQIDQVNLRPLHVAGYTGKNITIAVIDTGYPNVNTGSAFKRLRDNGQIKGGYNFVSKNEDIYNVNLNSHGAICLGVIGGYIENQFVGTAPDADFYLYASEDGVREIPEEELYWIEAAEEADRKGVDLISTSLGYTTFDDSRYNYTYADMDGQTSFIARGAQIAVEKGIFVSFAAGNEGNLPWHYISTPADNAKVFTIGAVDGSGNSSTFTSFGPNADNVIKPDASAKGTTTATVNNNSLTFANGTSLANPLAAGGIASLMQALPKSISINDLKSKLTSKASLYPNYNYQKGYGILNFGAAYTSSLDTQDYSKSKNISVYPNPAKDLVNIKIDDTITSVELYDQLGRLIKTEKTSIINVSKLTKGTYYLKVKTASKDYIEKIIKD